MYSRSARRSRASAPRRSPRRRRSSAAACSTLASTARSRTAPGCAAARSAASLSLAQQVVAALDLPQPQHAPGVLGPQFGVGARVPLALGCAPEQLHGVDQVLHHAVRVELAQECARAPHRRVCRPAGGIAAAPVAVERELLGQGHEALQYAGRDLGEGMGNARAAASVALPALVTVVALATLHAAAEVGGVRRDTRPVSELRVRQRGKVRPALAEPLLYVLRAVLEHEQRLVPSQRSEQRLLDAGRELVPLPVARAVALAPRDQSAEQHLGEFGGAGVGQHRPLHQLHHRQTERCRGEIDRELPGDRGGRRAEAADQLRARTAGRRDVARARPAGRP